MAFKNYKDENHPSDSLTTQEIVWVQTSAGGVIPIQEGSAPSATAGYGKIYVKSSDNKIYFKNSSGTEYDLLASALTPKDNIVPTGTIDGSNKTFTLPDTPSTGTLHLYKNGMRLKPTVDYSITGDTITMVEAPESGSELLADYKV